MRADKKIIAVNLALLLIFSLFFCIPAYAEEEDVCVGYACPSEIRGGGEEGFSDGMSLAVEALTDPYRIYVGSTSFYSNTSASGAGWTYNGSNNRLTLDGYNGPSIKTSGDLVIYSYGTVTVSGSDSSSGYDAITVGGSLDFILIDGTAALTGGNGTSSFGGDGIDASVLFVYALDDTVFNCSGGDGATYGGHGINGVSVDLYPNAATIMGGNGGTFPGSGIDYYSDLYIDVCSMVAQGGGTAGYGISYSGSGSNFYISPHVTLVRDDNHHMYTFTPKTYTLTLDGNGGTYNGIGSVSLPGPYPTYTDLGDYVFSRNEYQQVGWATASDLSAVYPLSAYYLPNSDTTLYASWTEVDDSTVLFIGNGGSISGELFWKTTTGASVHMPDRNEAVASDSNLIGWTDSLKLTSDDDHMLCGGSRWYMPGAAAKLDAQTTLYAQWSSEYGNIIYYNGNGGTNGAGSAAAVQGILSSGSSLSLYVQDDLGFARTGYRFIGWKDASGTAYQEGAEVPTPTASLSVTELFAQWLQVFTSSDGRDTVTCTLVPDLHSVDVSLSVTSLTSSHADAVKIYYVLYKDDRMIGLALNTAALSESGLENSATVEYRSSYEPDRCKIFHNSSRTLCSGLRAR